MLREAMPSLGRASFLFSFFGTEETSHVWQEGGKEVCAAEERAKSGVVY